VITPIKAQAAHIMLKTATQEGFTLIELLVTLIVGLILASTVIPSLTSLYHAHRSDSEIRKAQQLLVFARNQAISYGLNVTVCPIGEHINSCGVDWLRGITVLYDNNGVDQSIKLINGFSSQDSLTFASKPIIFSPDGLASTSAVMTYCSGDRPSNCQSLRLLASGRVNTLH